jgi:hypothetical protein
MYIRCLTRMVILVYGWPVGMSAIIASRPAIVVTAATPSHPPASRNIGSKPAVDETLPGRGRVGEIAPRPAPPWDRAPTPRRWGCRPEPKFRDRRDSRLSPIPSARISRGRLLPGEGAALLARRRVIARPATQLSADLGWMGPRDLEGEPCCTAGATLCRPCQHHFRRDCRGVNRARWVIPAGRYWRRTAAHRSRWASALATLHRSAAMIETMEAGPDSSPRDRREHVAHAIDRGRPSAWSRATRGGGQGARSIRHRRRGTNPEVRNHTAGVVTKPRHHNQDWRTR